MRKIGLLLALALTVPLTLKAATFDGHMWNESTMGGKIAAANGLYLQTDYFCSHSNPGTRPGYLQLACNVPPGSDPGTKDIIRKMDHFYRHSANRRIGVVFVFDLARYAVGNHSTDDEVKQYLKRMRDDPECTELAKAMPRHSRTHRVAAIVGAAIQGGAAASQEHADHPFESPLGTALVGAAAANGRKTTDENSGAAADTQTGCGIAPITPIPPIGCKKLKATCVCAKGGKCHWEFVCIPD